MMTQKMRMMMAGIATLALAACGQSSDSGNIVAAAPVAATPPPAGTDWVSTVVATPDGGFRMGNPNAPVKVIEYGSVTCPHCAAFSTESAEAIKTKYVSNGKVSWEFRSYLLHGQDVGITMAVQCGGPVPFFTILEQLYADQQNWLGKLIALSPAEQAKMEALPINQQVSAIVKASGVDTFLEQRGVGKEQLAQCLADTTMPDKLLKMRDRGNTQFNITGTPTFIINGQTVPETASWAALEPKLRAAVGG